MSTSYPIQGFRYRQDAGVPDQQLHLAGSLHLRALQRALAGEAFFKWIMQFFGPSGNAVKSHIGIAVSVYVLVAMVKKRLNLDASRYTLLRSFSVTLFEKMRLQ